MIRPRLHYISSNDTLMLICHDEMYDTYELKDDICLIYNCDKQIIGVNYFNASKYFGELSQSGYFEDQTILNICNDLLAKKSNVSLEFDTNNYLYVGKVISCEPHSDSDHLHVCKVDVGDEILDIVCGAKNCRQGLLVVVAKINAIMPNGKLIVFSKLRNVASYGMLCSAKELGVNYAQIGILELNDNYKIGSKFEWKGL